MGGRQNRGFREEDDALQLARANFASRSRREKILIEYSARGSAASTK